MGEHIKAVLLAFAYIYLAALDLSWGMWDPVPQPGMEPGPPALGLLSLSHWTTREVSTQFIKDRSKAHSKEGNVDVLTSEEC